MSVKPNSNFENRFRGVVSKMRTTCVSTAIGWTLLALCTCFAIVVGCDFFFETDWSLRAILFFSILMTALISCAVGIHRSRKRWQRSKTAVEIENRFQDLGQSVRTSVQLNDGESHGFSESLSQELDKEVNKQTQELRLGEAVSTGPLKIAIALLALVLLVIAGFCFSGPQWRLAASRVLLGNTPYTTIKVQQGDVRVEEKATFTLDTEIAGRTNRQTVLMTRNLGDENSEWAERPLLDSDELNNENNLVSYQVKIPKVRKPFEYQVIAGKYSSPVHRVDVRYPLVIEGFNVELTMPEYTGLRKRIIKKGSFAAVEGSTAQIQIEVDHAPQKAWLEIRPTNTPHGEQPEIEKVDLEIDGTKLTTVRDLDADCLYRVFAELSDGTSLTPNRYRIRVHGDSPPRVSFELPEPLIEVHALAELLMRLRVSDDFGLKRAGIVFQLNNDPEIVLEEKEFEDIVNGKGDPTPQLQAYLQTTLPLEYFEMTVKDSISYYGFAEDNCPHKVNRNESDLRFIDVRPFRRMYAIPDGNGLAGTGRQNQDLPALDEMIGRERYAINRTIQLKRNIERGRDIDTSIIDNLIGLQNETSEFSGQLGDRAAAIEERFGIPEDGRISDQMYRAQEAMLASVDSLASAEYEVALLQEKDAVRYLIDARQVLENAVPGNGNRAALAQLRKFGRNLFRRMRKPKNDRERVREITRRLNRAALEQSYLMEKASDLIPPEMPELEEEEEEEEEVEEEVEEEEVDPAELEIEPDSELEDPQSEQDDQADSMADLMDELQDKQTDLLREVDDIGDMINELNQVSELAKKRTEKAVQQVEKVNAAMSRRQMELAMEEAEMASSALAVLASNIEGVTADEAAKRLGVARDLSMALTEDLQQLGAALEENSESAEELDLEGDELTEFESKLARQSAETAETQSEIAMSVEDILESILDPEQGIVDPADEMVKRLQELMAENKFEESVSRTNGLAAVINTLQWEDALVETRDLADRFDVFSQRLDAMHREILSPRIEQLRKLEQRAVETKSKLNSLQSEEEISRWHQRADGLVDDVESAGIAEKQTEKVREAMSQAGWESEDTGGWNWKLSNQGTAVVPVDYDSTMENLVGEIRRHIAELTIVGVANVNSGNVPPKYKHLVDRYLEVLAGAADEDETDDLN